MQKSSLSLIIKLFQVFSQICFAVILAKFLGAKNYGVYSYCISLIVIFTAPVKTGLGNLLVREFSVYKSKNQWPLLNGLLKRSSQLLLLGWMIIPISIAIFLYFFSGNDDNERFAIIVSIGLLLPGMAFLGYIEGALRGLGNPIIGQLPDMVLRPLFFFGILYCNYILANSFSSLDAIIFHSIASFIAVLIGIYFIKKNLPNQLFAGKSVFISTVWFRSFIPLTGNGGIKILNREIPVIICGLFLPVESVGFIKIAILGGALSLFSLEAINQVVAPKIAEYFYGSDSRLQALIKIVSRVVFVTSLMSFLVYLFFGKFILSFFFGPDFVIAYVPLLILSLGYSFSSFFGNIETIMNMTGNETKMLYISVFIGILNLIFCFSLIPEFGINGAAFSVVITVISMKALSSAFLWQKHKIRTIPF